MTDLQATSNAWHRQPDSKLIDIRFGTSHDHFASIRFAKTPRSRSIIKKKKKMTRCGQRLVLCGAVTADVKRPRRASIIGWVQTD
jgi:hypothetical protein